jgi:hypothetical protein
VSAAQARAKALLDDTITEPLSMDTVAVVRDVAPSAELSWQMAEQIEAVVKSAVEQVCLLPASLPTSPV